MVSNKLEFKTSRDKSESWEALNPLLKAMFKDFQELSKKKPNDPLNEKKVELVNRLLQPVLVILESELTRGYLDLLDKENLPSNSDVSLMLGQFMASMDAFRSKYYGYSDNHKHEWYIN
jgi:hypothetical protein